MLRIILLMLLNSFTIFSFSTPLPASEVFQVNSKVIDPVTINVQFISQPGYFLYQKRIDIKSQNPAHIQLTPIQYPKAKIKTDTRGKQFSVYRGIVQIPIKLKQLHAGNANIIIKYQGCSDAGFCYPPETRNIHVTIDNQNHIVSSELISDTGVQPVTSQKNISHPTKEQEIEVLFSEQHHAFVLLVFFGFGLLLAFTPCVLPMIPVLSSIIVGQGEKVTTRKAFLVSLSYVTSMALTYAIVGALVAALGSNLQLVMQSPVIIGLFSLIFVALALSMFGLYELRLPVNLQSKLASVQRRQSSGHYLGAAVMGCLSTLILSPCVTAPLIGALSYIAHSGEILFGSLALFFLGLGMGVPLLIIGTSAGKLLPKAGPWMNQVKNLFGILLIAVAIFLASRILPSFATMLLWASLLIFSGLYAGAFQPSQHTGKKILQAMGMLFFIYGFLILIGAAMGSDNPVKPLTPLTQRNVNKPSIYPMTIVNNQSALAHAAKQAHGKPVMIDFYADWCTSCKVMEQGLMQQPDIQRALENYTVIKADVTRLAPEQKELLRSFNVVAPPTFIFLDKRGKEIRNSRLVGEQSDEAFFKHLNNVLHQ